MTEREGEGLRAVTGSAEDAARAADRAKSEFLATLSHELRNSLAPIRNALEALRLAGPVSGQLQWTVDVIGRQTQQMTRVVDDLLDVARISRGRLELRRARIELGAVLDAAVQTSRPVVEAAGHQLTVSRPTEPVYADGDAARLAQVISNLLNNAAKYTDRGGHVTLQLERRDGEAVISVRDTGIGISPAALPQIFEMFGQADEAVDRSRGGLGIGLTLARRLVDLHGGTISARSDGPGTGSEFVVRLPVLGPGESASQPASGGGEAAGPASPLRILVVDDSSDAATSLGMLLRITGNEVRTAQDGLEAVDVAGQFRPDVILLDVGLPKLNGHDAARRIRAHEWGKAMVLIAVTGWGQAEDRQRSKDAGFDHHLVKPVEPAALQRLLASLRPGAAHGKA